MLILIKHSESHNLYFHSIDFCKVVQESNLAVDMLLNRKPDYLPFQTTFWKSMLQKIV